MERQSVGKVILEKVTLSLFGKWKRACFRMWAGEKKKTSNGTKGKRGCDLRQWQRVLHY